MSVGQILERNNERPSWVRFEVVEKEDKVRSAAAGYYVAKDVELACITPPGSKDVFKQEVKSWFEQLERDMKGGRIPQQWVEQYKEAYKRWKSGQDIPVNGTPIKGWLRISPAQTKQLLEMGVRTIEDLASLNDEGLRRLGMGAVNLKNIAIAELQAAKDIGPVVRENAQLKEQVSVLTGSVEALQRQVETLMQHVKAEQPASAEISANDILDAELSEQEIIAQYTERFGPPHHRMKVETMAAKLKE